MKRLPHLRLATLTGLTVLSLAAAAFALDLQSAKQRGLVGETPEGYIAAVAATGEAQALVQDINQRRREEYQRISAGNGQPLSVVEKLAAQKLYERIQPGEYYRDGSAWKRK